MELFSVLRRERSYIREQLKRIKANMNRKKIKKENVNREARDIKALESKLLEVEAKISNEIEKIGNRRRNKREIL